MAIESKITGMIASDFIVRSAIEKGLANLRAKPWLLDYVFASFRLDELTKDKYGQKTITKAKEWFLANEIIVHSLVSANQPPSAYMVTVTHNSSIQENDTLADINYDVQESSDMQWPILYGPFTPVSYDKDTGYLTFPDDVVGSLFLAVDQLLIDSEGVSHPIEQVISNKIVKIETNLRQDLNKATIKAQPPALITMMESSIFKEEFSIGCVCAGEVEYTTWLHSIIQFILLAYKETLLEARNFERSIISSSPVEYEQMIGQEQFYSRTIKLTGYCENMWPKSIKPRIQGIDFSSPYVASQINVADGYLVPLNDEDDVELTLEEVSIGMPRSGQLVYFGAAANGTLNQAFAEALSNNTTATSRQRDILFEANGSTEYCWYILPTIMGGDAIYDDFIDKSTGFAASFSKITTISIDSVDYDVWRSAQPGLGIWTLRVL